MEKTISKRKKVLDYAIKTFNGMALGLFATLIVGTIIKTIGNYAKSDVLLSLAKVLMNMMGIGIGAGIALSLKKEGLKMICAVVAGGIATNFGAGYTLNVFGIDLVIKNEPLLVYIVVVGVIELSNLVLVKKTPVDIIIVPMFFAFVAMFITLLMGTPVTWFTKSIGKFIGWATEITPFFMGIFIAVVMGMALTAPISSAAIAISIALGSNSEFSPEIMGIAGGAALTGCCVQMLGFAVMSRKDNNIGTVISIGIGTSMLQFKNILKKPIIWLPTIIVSAILGPVSTLVFKMTCTSGGSGMGTSGLVGQICSIESMQALNYSPSKIILTILILQITLPIILVYIVDLIFRKANLIVEGDLKL